jgi:uncharacterized iron-regulated membrane protein
MPFLRRPQGTTLRKVAFQLHLWTGLAVGAYAVLIGLTGAALVFRPELQARAYPQYFAVRSGADLAEPSVVIGNLAERFPDYRFSGIDYPTYRRGTFLSYLVRDNELRTVFSDPVSGRVLGELPHDGWIQQLQELHFNLLAGQTGNVVNGVLAACLLVMCVTGLVIWWPGSGRWRLAFTVDLRRGWKRINWELHGAMGIWAGALLAVWALSGVYFSFPGQFRSAVNVIAPMTVHTARRSDPARTPSSQPPSAAALLERAHHLVPGAQTARFVVPSRPADTYVVVLARQVHGDSDSSDEVTLYFDQYSGALLESVDGRQRTAGDQVMTWLGLLHVGSFGGLPVKLAWTVFGLAYPALFGTGVVMWWNRVVSRRQRARLGEPA